MDNNLRPWGAFLNFSQVFFLRCFLTYITDVCFFSVLKATRDSCSRRKTVGMCMMGTDSKGETLTALTSVKEQAWTLMTLYHTPTL